MKLVKHLQLILKAENFKMVSDDYDVAISKQKISHFVNRNKPIQYWIALEHSTLNFKGGYNVDFSVG